jgi:hypothetical protein
MRIGIKSAVALALGTAAALTGTNAALAQCVGPYGTLCSTDQGAQTNQDLVLFVQAQNSAGTVEGTYALNTGINIDTLLPTSAITGNNVLKVVNGIPTDTIGPSTTLSNFLSANSANTIIWGVEGGYYNDLGSSPTLGDAEASGTTKAVFSSAIGTLNPNKVGAMQTGNLQTLLSEMYAATGGGVTQFAQLLGSVSSTATESNVATWSSTDQAKGGALTNGAVPDVIANGAVSDLFGVTGNVVEGVVQSYLLGTVTFNNGTLTITGNGSAVPLPAAVWLLGSGLMALFGLSRRRAVTTA